MIQEILLADKSSKDVMPSIRSLKQSSKVLAVNQIDDFDAVAKQKESYLQKVRGYFKAPETGEYKFYSSCSGPCQIFIGQEKSLSPRKIINQKEESLHNEFTRYPDQVSHTIYLEKDKLYYIEGVEKQHGGLGHLSVGVVLPSDEKIFPISKKYLNVGDVGGLNRKEEISRNNGQDLAKQKDKMIKKLRDINDYIKKLTDEVKKNPKLAKSVRKQENVIGDGSILIKNDIGDKERGIEVVEKVSEPMSVKKDESLSHVNRKENEEEQSWSTGEGSALKMVAEEQGFGEKMESGTTGTNQAQQSQENLDRSTKNVNLKEKGLQKEVHVPTKGVSNNKKKRVNEKDMLVAVVEKGVKEHNAPKMMHETSTKVVDLTANEDSSGNGIKELHPVHGHPSPAVEFDKSPTGNVDSEPKQLVVDNESQFNGLQLPHENDHPEQNGVNQAPAFSDHENMLGPIHGDSKLMVEHNYVKMLKTGNKVESVHSTTKYDMHPTNNDMHQNIDEDDDNDDDVLRLTSFAKEEISRNGNLSDSAIKKFIKTIKRKLIQSGFVKRANMTSVNDTGVSHTEKKDEREANIGEKNTTTKEYNKETRSRASPMESFKVNPNKGKLFLYDEVVSNLLRLLKGNVEKNTEKELENQKSSIEADESKGSAQLRAKLISTGRETEERRRMLKSLHLLSDEIDNFKRILQEHENQRRLSDVTEKANSYSQKSEVNQITPSFEKMTSPGDMSNDAEGQSDLEPKKTNDDKPLARQSDGNAVSRTKMPENYENAEKYGEKNNKQRFGQVVEERIKQEAISSSDLNGNMAADFNKKQSQDTWENEENTKLNLSLPTELSKERNVEKDRPLQFSNKPKQADSVQRFQQSEKYMSDQLSKYITKSSSSKPLLIEGYTGLVRKVENDNTTDIENPLLKTKDTAKDDLPDNKVSYTDALTKTVENLLTGVSVPALLADPMTGALPYDDGQGLMENKQINGKQKSFISSKKVAQNRQPYNLETSDVISGLR
eukprot:gene11367-21562_t